MRKTLFKMLNNLLRFQYTVLYIFSCTLADELVFTETPIGSNSRRERPNYPTFPQEKFTAKRKAILYVQSKITH